MLILPRLEQQQGGELVWTEVFQIVLRKTTSLPRPVLMIADTYFLVRLPIHQTRIHLETSLLTRIIPEEDQLVSAKVRIPPLYSGTGDKQEVFTYPAWWLALHALNRMVDAEDELKALRTAMRITGHLNQHQHSAVGLNPVNRASTLSV